MVGVRAANSTPEGKEIRGEARKYRGYGQRIFSPNVRLSLESSKPTVSQPLTIWPAVPAGISQRQTPSPADKVLESR